MSDSERRDNSGALGINRNRTKDTHPEYSGNLRVNGVDYWLSAWVRTGKDGSKFFSLAVKPKEQKAGVLPPPASKGVADVDAALGSAPKPANPESTPAIDGEDDDVPF